MRHLLSKSVILVLTLILSAQFAFSFDDADYTTPDTWSQHISAGRIVQSMKGVGLTENTSLYTTLTTRLRLKSNEYADDSDVYQYVRMHTDAAELGNGTVKFSLFGRIADDLDGYSDNNWSSNYYYAQRDILDAEDSSISGRLYQGYVQFDGVVKNTVISLGRVYLNRMNTFQIDGGDAGINIMDAATVYAYGGKPVSYFYDLDDASVYGAGGTFNLTEDSRIQVEYTSVDTGEFEDEMTQVRFVQVIPRGTVMVGYESLNDADTYSADIDYSIEKTGTILSLSYKVLTEDIEGDKTYVTNPITYALADQSKYSRYKASIYQPFMKYFVAGLNYEAKTVNGEENFDNRNFKKYGAKFDVNGLITPDTYLSISADQWVVEETDKTSENNRAMYGFQLGHKVNDAVDVWAGSAFSRYEYDVMTDTRKDSVRSYYVGCEYQPMERLGVMVDLTREDTDFYDDLDDELSENYIIELWANLAF